MKRQMQSVFFATIAATAFSVVAQTTTAPATSGAQQGTTAGSPSSDTHPATPSTAGGAPGYQSAPPASPTMGSPSPNTRSKMTDEEIRQYVSARRDCNAQPATQQASCQQGLNARFSSVDPKCQKLADAALETCLRGADRGE